MKPRILRGKFCFTVSAWLVLFYGLGLVSPLAQTDTIQNSIRITWRDETCELYSYTFHSIQTNRVEVYLVKDRKILSVHGVQRVGGIDALLSLVETASKEATAKNGDGTVELKPEDKRELEITYVKNSAAQKFSIAGNYEELTQFFYSTPALKELLLFASEQQPKAYRLVDEFGPNRATLHPPKQ